MIGQTEHVLVELGVVGDEHAALARGHGLGTVEGERAKCAHRPGAPAMVDRAHGLGRIFNDGDAKLLPQSQQLIHMAQIAVEMDRDDGLGARGNRRTHCLRVKAPCIGQNIDQHRLGAQVHHGRNAGHPVRVCQDHFITRPDAQRRHAHVQCAGAARRGNGVAHAHMVSKGLFKPMDVVVATISPAVLDGICHQRHFRIGD